MEDHQEETPDERRERIMRRLAEMLEGPPPSTTGAGPVSGGVEQAIAALGLGLSDEDTAEVAGALREGPPPEEAEALFRALLTGFQGWQRNDQEDDAGEADEEA